MTYILGISAFYHDAAAALLKNGKIVGAIQEERLSRIKNDSSYPYYAIEYLLKQENISIFDIEKIIFYEKPFLKFERLIETYLSITPKGFKSFLKALPIWTKQKFFLKNFLFKKLKLHDSEFNFIERIYFSEHHLSHAASAFYPSPFSEAIILTADGVGEWATTTVSVGYKNKIDIVKEINFPHSLGLLYSAFTFYTGFEVNKGEYKMMGLAPYGTPKYEKLIEEKLLDIKEDGSFRLNQKYFNYMSGLTMINENFIQLFGKKNRQPEEKIEQFHMDIASSIQKVIEKVLIKIVKSLRSEFKIQNLCLAGGVALNSVANGKIADKKIFKNLWVQPASGDAGGSLGSALAYWYNEKNNERSNIEEDTMQGSYLGCEYKHEYILNFFNSNNIVFKELDENEILHKTAKDLANGLAIGWFQGKMEFGPRALGNRSILADPTSEKMQSKLNLKIKFRESFRPFAPSILEEFYDEWFDMDKKSPYMMYVHNIKDSKKLKVSDINKKLFGIDLLNIKRSLVPAITHVDYTARVQTVSKNINYKFYNLIKNFYDLTGCPMLINTSFNINNEPIVCSPSDAYKCFMTTDIDILVIDNFYLKKADQIKW